MRFITAKENLACLIFQDINENYGWGKYGEFKLIIRKADGYVNATKMCKVGGKELFNWIKLDGSHKLIDAFERSLQICRELLIQPIMDCMRLVARTCIIS